MAPPSDDFHQTPSPAGSPHARDRGLRRSRRLTRWIAVTAVAGAAALGSLYTHLLPGTSAAPAPPSPPVHYPAASTAATTGDDREHGEAGDHEDDGEAAAPVTEPTPQPPAQPPAATRQQPHTTTGAS
ncbi:hypothetical protein ACI2L1_40970 [Streptomyces sp. NPDC019531]|uniref:hypothetical protein n=1 Tax=Streptomyces sp. NPDC019531 TaxID=3365062 RepID=UPI00384BB6DF